MVRCASVCRSERVRIATGLMEDPSRREMILVDLVPYFLRQLVEKALRLCMHLPVPSRDPRPVVDNPMGRKVVHRGFISLTWDSLGIVL